MLLPDMDNREERTRRESGTTFDFGAVRKSLGM